MDQSHDSGIVQCDALLDVATSSRHNPNVMNFPGEQRGMSSENPSCIRFQENPTQLHASGNCKEKAQQHSSETVAKSTCQNLSGTDNASRSCFENVRHTVNHTLNEMSHTFRRLDQTAMTMTEELINNNTHNTETENLILLKSLEAHLQSNRQCLDIVASTLSRILESVQKSNLESLDAFRSTLLNCSRNRLNCPGETSADSTFVKTFERERTKQNNPGDISQTDPSRPEELAENAPCPTSDDANSQTFAKVFDTQNEHREGSSLKTQMSHNESSRYKSTTHAPNEAAVARNSKPIRRRRLSVDHTGCSDEPYVDHEKNEIVFPFSRLPSEKVEKKSSSYSSQVETNVLADNHVRNVTVDSTPLAKSSGDNDLLCSVPESSNNSHKANGNLDGSCITTCSIDNLSYLNDICEPEDKSEKVDTTKQRVRRTYPDDDFRIEDLSLVCDKSNLELYSLLLNSGSTQIPPLAPIKVKPENALSTLNKDAIETQSNLPKEIEIKSINTESPTSRSGVLQKTKPLQQRQNRDREDCQPSLVTAGNLAIPDVVVIPTDNNQDAVSAGSDSISLSLRKQSANHRREDMHYLSPCDRPTMTNLRISPSKIDPMISDDFELNLLLLNIAKELDDEDILKMKFLCTGRSGIPGGVLERLKTPLEFFQHLKERVMISRDNLLLLQAFLWQVDRKDLHKMAADYARLVGDTLYFHCPKEEPEDGFEYIQFHIEGNLDSFQRDKMEALRSTVARLLFVKPEFIFLSGVEPSHSLMVTLMINHDCVDDMKKAFLGNKDTFGKLGVDGISLEGEALLDPLLAVRRASAPAGNITTAEITELYHRSVQLERRAAENEVRMLQSREDAEMAWTEARRWQKKENYYRSMLLRAIPKSGEISRKCGRRSLSRLSYPSDC